MLDKLLRVECIKFPDGFCKFYSLSRNFTKDFTWIYFFFWTPIKSILQVLEVFWSRILDPIGQAAPSALRLGKARGRPNASQVAFSFVDFW